MFVAPLSTRAWCCVDGRGKGNAGGASLCHPSRPPPDKQTKNRQTNIRMFCTRRAVSTTRTTLHGSLVSCRHACSRRAYSSRPIIPETSAPPSSSSSPQPPRSANGDGKKVTLRTLRRLYETKRPITFMTAHDYPSGLFVDRAGLDACLVGDSLAMVTLGYEHTSSVTVDVCRAFSNDWGEVTCRA